MANEARTKLRNMGGIMASSPELMQAAGYQQGGQVTPMGPFVVPGDPRVSVAPRAPAGGIETMVPSVRDPETRGQRQTQRFRESAYDTIQDVVGDYVLDPLAYVSGAGTRALGAGLDVMGGTTALLGLDRISANYESESDRLYNRGKTLMRSGFSGIDAIDPADYNLEPSQFEYVLRRAQQDVEAEEAAAEEQGEIKRSGRERAQQELQRVLPSGMRIGEEPEGAAQAATEAETQRAESDQRARADAALRLQETAPEELLTLGGKLSEPTEVPPPPEDDDNTPGARRTLRQRYDERLELFKDIFGESDEARARDRAMSLAMLGLAIASGQSPNALTNIAQGAMAGLQGMSEQERARREQEQGLRTLALETAIAEQDAASEAEREAEASRLEFEREKILEGIRAGGRSSGAGYENVPRVAEQAVTIEDQILKGISEGTIAVPEQYRSNQQAFITNEKNKRVLEYIDTLGLEGQIPDAQTRGQLGQQFMYKDVDPEDPQAGRFPVVRSARELSFILPGQDYLRYNPSTGTYTRETKPVSE